MTHPSHNALAPKECERRKGAYQAQCGSSPSSATLSGLPLLAACLLWGVGLGARAQTTGHPAEQSADRPIDCARAPAPDAAVADAQAYFASLEPHCLRSAAYYRQHGQWLLKQGSHGAALEALERALLLEPEHLGTQLDYAQALIMVGDAASADGILSSLQAQPDVPSHLIPLLAKQLQALRQVAAADPAPTGMVSKVMFSQSFGGDSNLNNAASANSITLTYPTIDLDLPLAQANRPQSGPMATTALQWTGLLAQGRHMWLLQAQGRARHTSNPASRYQQAELEATWLQNPAAPQQWLGRVDHTQLYWGGKKLYASEKLGLQHQWVHNADPISCRTALGAEVENRSYPDSRPMNGLYRGGLFTLVCQKQDSLSLQLRTGQDQPRQAERPGGIQRQSEARVQWQFNAVGNRWQTEYSIQHQQDDTGYSPLLSRNVARRVVRQALRLETSRPLQWPALGDPQWFGTVEISRQTSNLQIFASSRNAVQTGLRWVLP